MGSKAVTFSVPHFHKPTPPQLIRYRRLLAALRASSVGKHEANKDIYHNC